ncbi:MAG: DMT family transporter [Caldilineae bacterium]|nr:MAG: DMT family transporter [Caldilineae bacterium]
MHRQQRSPSTPWPYVGLGVLAQFIWGSYPVFAKRAVMETPKFSLLTFAWLASMLVGALLMRWREHIPWQQVWTTFRRMRILWALSGFLAVRSVTNIVAIELTRATWVQLINLLTPFAVALLGVWFFEQPIPRYTFRALLLSLTGAVLMLVQDWSDIALGMTWRDGLGLATALLSTLSLAFYFQLVRRGRIRQVSSGMIMVQQGMTMWPVFLALSLLIGEDWSAWGSVSGMGWVAIMAVIWLVQVSGNLIQITALGGANPALITSLMALRLVSALLLAWLLLGEMLVTPAQWLGALLVILTVSIYLWLQRDRAPTAAATEKAT